MRRVLWILMVCGLALPACTSGGPARAGQSSTGPYLVVAIDYHFHNAHPTPPLSRDQRLVFDNQSINLHNVTIPGTSFSEDFEPLRRIVIARIGSLFSKPGRYVFFCKYHLDRGMKGVIVVR